ncbi:MAG TPA: hypothetical protein VML94_02845 [Thermoplasmata archaeon]|nr:hypothetical protein [Thermoplasmata archaeon]
MQGAASPDSSSRRARTLCKFCGRPIDLARMREHLRGEHQADSTKVEALYLTARVEARKSQRSRT